MSKIVFIKSFKRKAVQILNRGNKELRAKLRMMPVTKAKALLAELELPEREFNCILWHDIQQLPMDIVADKLRVSVTTAKRIHSRSLTKAQSGFVVELWS